MTGDRAVQHCLLQEQELRFRGVPGRGGMQGDGSIERLTKTLTTSKTAGEKVNSSRQCGIGGRCVRHEVRCARMKED